jgi:protein SCO1/2
MKVVPKQFVSTIAMIAMTASLLSVNCARAGSLYSPAEKSLAAPGELNDITVIEHIGSQLPLDLPFKDETGKTVHLGQYFTGKKPVVLQLGYYQCPMLCSLVSRGLLDSVKQVSFTAGKDYDLVFVSIDPKETPELAMQKKEAFLQEYGRDSAAGWHFLTGKQEDIAALAQVDGFVYKWVQSAGKFAHPAALTLATPEGKISRYLYGVRFDPTTLRLSLVECSEGRLGTTFDKSYLTCFAYDGAQGRYAFAAMNIMRSGGVLIMIVVAFTLVRMFRREAKLRKEREAAGLPMDS